VRHIACKHGTCYNIFHPSIHPSVCHICDLHHRGSAKQTFSRMVQVKGTNILSVRFVKKSSGDWEPKVRESRRRRRRGERKFFIIFSFQNNAFWCIFMY